ncbi:hypothetical protein C9374_006758 [Naegleria lovaniensis]|uniref:UBC core domain-containing protein n=1 Tax=Naegleria lovaniensis TaxID=51637 RepID=A0AA88GNF1_NAELO|nr:uncharacterized protein C9374_006758 [Naegleria lovaniensis]KAG2379641.1 hypothetical protein C9374_006758 [Naegleria lovaniensis]
MFAKRIQKEIQKLIIEQDQNQKALQNGNTALRQQSGMGIDIFLQQPIDNLEIIYCTLFGAKGTIYEGEEFLLRFKFPNDYPLSSPEVVFIPPKTPIHEHVYSNGHICLNILYDGWSPVMNIQTVCLSIQSMLSSATEKKRPKDNDSYVLTSTKSPKQTRWFFHDDTV